MAVVVAFLLRFSIVFALLWLQPPLGTFALRVYNEDSTAFLATYARCRTYTVKSGDTCYAIAQAHGISLADFLNMNPGINCSNLQIGQVVCISGGGRGGGSSGCTTYTVKAGDTCYGIAEAKGISLSDFLNINPGINCNNLQIGQEVCISAGGGANGNVAGQ